MSTGERDTFARGPISNEQRRSDAHYRWARERFENTGTQHLESIVEGNETIRRITGGNITRDAILRPQLKAQYQAADEVLRERRLGAKRK